MSALHIGYFRALAQDQAVVPSGTREVRVPVKSRGFRTPGTARATAATDAGRAGSGTVLTGPDPRFGHAPSPDGDGPESVL